MVDIEQCSGSASTGGKHLRINNPLRTKRVTPLAVALHTTYQGSVTEWFHNFISTEDIADPKDNCWRNDSDNKTKSCSGKRKDTTDLVVSLPVIFILEVSEPLNLLDDNSNHLNTPVWDFPATLLPSTQQMADEVGLVFDLVGLALLSHAGSHFVARHISEDHSGIFDYDGMKHNGYPLLNKTAKFDTHLVGKSTSLPKGFHVHQAIYQLRGGIEAQDHFFQMQCQAYGEKFRLKFSSQSVDVLPMVSYIGHDLVEYSPPNKRKVRISKTEYLLRNAPDLKKNLKTEKEQEKSPMYISSNSPESEEETTGHIQPATSIRSPSSSITSLPNSPFNLKCICGLRGDGNVTYDQDAGVSIQCDECHHWSHVACQRGGRASDLTEKDPFICDFCDLRMSLPSKPDSRRSLRK